MSEELEFEIITKSDNEADKFKYNNTMKKDIFNIMIKDPFLFPVIVYVKNPDIPDLKKVLHLVDRNIDINCFLEVLKSHLEYERDDVEYGLRPELEPNEFMCGDLQIGEAHEYISNRDFLLYLILDVKN